MNLWAVLGRRIRTSQCYKATLIKPDSKQPTHHALRSSNRMTTGIGCPQTAEAANRLIIWNAAAKVLNMQSQTADDGWPSKFRIQRLANVSPKEPNLCYDCYNTPRNWTDYGTGSEQLVWTWQ